jgi:hypothetical protein
MLCRLPIVLAIALVLGLAGCSESAKQARPEPISGSPNAQPINGNPLTQVRTGMTKGQVRNLLGPPSSRNSYYSWISWFPGSFNDSQRTSWHYEGRGEVVFSEPRFSGAPAKVLDVEIEPPRPGTVRVGER